MAMMLPRTSLWWRNSERSLRVSVQVLCQAMFRSLLGCVDEFEVHVFEGVFFFGDVGDFDALADEPVDDAGVVVCWVLDAEVEGGVLDFGEGDAGEAGDGLREGRRDVVDGDRDGAGEDAVFEVFGVADFDEGVFDEGDLVADAFCFGEVVGVDEDGGALGFEVEDVVADEFGCLGVEAGGGLVEEEVGWVVDEGAGDGDLLFHAFGEAADGLAAPVPEVEVVQGAFD